MIGKCHTGAKPQAESWCDTERTRIYRVIPDTEPNNKFIIPVSH